jgi:hypothetical protein
MHAAADLDQYLLSFVLRYLQNRLLGLYFKRIDNGAGKRRSGRYSSFILAIQLRRGRMRELPGIYVPYDAVGAKQPYAGSATKTRLPGVALVNMAAAHRMTAGVLNSGTAFDIYGRRLAGADRTAGLVVVKNSR